MYNCQVKYTIVFTVWNHVQWYNFLYIKKRFKDFLFINLPNQFKRDYKHVLLLYKPRTMDDTLWHTANCYKKWLANHDTDKIQLASFDNWKKYIQVLFDSGCYIGYIAKTAAEKTGALICSIKLFPSLEVALHLKKPTIQYSVKNPH